MLPPGHLAFAYLLALAATRRTPGVAGVVALLLGALFPTLSNEGMKEVDVGINHFWSHSPLVPAGLGVGALGLMRVQQRHLGAILGFFTLGLVSHLVGDFVTDFALLYLSHRVDDVGGSWLYPWRPIIVREPILLPGFRILWWQMAVEILFLAWSLWHWISRPKSHSIPVPLALGVALGVAVGFGTIVGVIQADRGY